VEISSTSSFELKTASLAMSLWHSSKADIADWRISWCVAEPESNSSCLLFAEEYSSCRLEPDTSMAVAYTASVASIELLSTQKVS